MIWRQTANYWWAKTGGGIVTLLSQPLEATTAHSDYFAHSEVVRWQSTTACETQVMVDCDLSVTTCGGNTPIRKLPSSQLHSSSFIEFKLDSSISLSKKGMENRKSWISSDVTIVTFLWQPFWRENLTLTNLLPVETQLKSRILLITPNPAAFLKFYWIWINPFCWKAKMMTKTWTKCRPKYVKISKVGNSDDW